MDRSYRITRTLGSGVWIRSGRGKSDPFDTCFGLGRPGCSANNRTTTGRLTVYPHVIGGLLLNCAGSQAKKKAPLTSPAPLLRLRRVDLGRPPFISSLQRPGLPEK